MTYKLYDFLPSGNAYKVRLLLTQLGLPFERIEIDILKGESRTPEFLAINPNGRVPVLEIEPNFFLAESNAILIYLSQETSFLPEDKFNLAKVMEWLFFEQYSHEPNIATPRFWISILKKEEEFREAIAQKYKLGYAALEVMENRLKEHPFLVGDRYTIADIALYAYTHVAEEGGFNLEQFPAIRTWFRAIEKQPNYISITHV